VSDTTDNPKSPDPAPRLDDLLAMIRGALSQDATAEARSAGALACRAILGALDSTSRASAPAAASPSPAVTSSTASSPFATLLGALAQTPLATSDTATSPVGTLLGAIRQIPREQLVEAVVGGLRSLLSSSGPTYLPRPMPTPTRRPDGVP